MGENEKPERITFSYLWEKVMAVLNFEKGLPFTIWQFAVYPGKAAKEYLFGDRKKFMDPVKFTVLAIAIGTYILVKHMAQQESPFEAMIPTEDEKMREGVTYLGQLFGEYYNVFLFLNIPLYALMTKILFKKKELYFAEHLVINAYLYAVATYSTIFFLPFPKEWGMITMNIFSILVSIYIVWAYKKIFEEGWFDTIGKGIIVLFVASMLYFFIVMFVLGIIAGYHVASLR